MNWKATVKLENAGIKLSLYSRFLWFFWMYEGGLKHLSTEVDGSTSPFCTQLIDEHLNRWKKIHAGDIIVQDYRVLP